MYKYTFDEETTKKLISDTEKSSTVFDKFKEIDSRYDSLSNYDDGSSLKEMTYEKPSSEEVKSQAETSLSAYKDNSIKSINEQFDTKNKNIDESIEEVKANKKSAEKEIAETYSAVKENAENDAIKRGLARSSIIVNKLAEYDSNMINNLNALQTETNNKIESLNAEKGLLEEQKQSALNSFDIEYAVKLQDKINSINSNIAEQEEKVIKYNNEIAQARAKLKDNYFDNTMTLSKFIAENGPNVIEYLKQQDKLKIVKKHFERMSTQEAINELENNSNYFKELGKTNYNELLEELKSR